MYYIYTTLVSCRRNVLRETQLIEHLFNMNNVPYRTIDISIEDNLPELVKNSRLPIVLWNNEFVGTYMSLQQQEDDGVLKMNLESRPKRKQ